MIALDAQGAPSLRVQVSQKGDFALIGNTLGHECAPGTPAPVVGTVGLCGVNLADSAPDVYWRADAPLPGQAQANTLVTLGQARSAAVLDIPDGGQVTHAFLYWGATLGAPGTDTSITLDREGGFSSPVDSVKCYQSTNNSYQCLADVTTIVQEQGEGAYRVGDVNIASLANVNSSAQFGGWWMAVFYTDPNGTLRNLALFDGLDPVANMAPQNTMLTGFLVPNNGFTAKLGVIAFEGDNSILGDQFLFNGGAALSDASNPADNFFNSTRSTLGAPTTVVGDLPQLTGTAQSMSGIDLDIADVTDKVMGGQNSAMVSGTSTGDVYYLAGFITSISDYRPNFTTSTKTVTDVNGGVAVPGDVLEYEIVAINTGNDTAINVVLSDPIPAGLTYVPGSLEITAGPNMGAKTDDAGDDQGEFANNTVIVRLGTGADEVQGGTVPINESSTIKFQVTIDADTKGLVANQALINAAGENGAPATDTPTDGNGGGDGAPATELLIEECGDDSMCPALTPKCNVDPEPNTCVECLADEDCGGLKSTCESETNTCVCVPNGDEICDGTDNDCNGELDEGFDAGDPCSAGVGACAVEGVQVCDTPDSTVCDAVPLEPSEEVCDGIDNNCDGMTDEGFNEGCGCASDDECGGPSSGQVCEPDVCIPGCRGVNGNGCPDGQMCTSSDETVGQCVPEEGTGGSDSASGTDSGPTEGSASASDSGPTEGSASATATDSSGSGSDSNSGGALDDEGFGCECNSNGSGAPMGLALLSLLALGRRRRRA